VLFRSWNAVAEKWGFDIFDPVLENPRFYLFCADLLTDSFSPGGLDLSALATEGFAAAVADACGQLDLPDVSAAAVSILGHLTDCMT